MTRGLVGISLVVLAACVPCEDVGPTFGEACLSPAMAADTTLQVEVREDCGSNCTGALDCTAIIDLDTVHIVATQSECLLDCVPDGTCQQRTTTCLIPALSPGDYKVVFPGLATKTLRVQPGAASSCVL